MSENMLATYTGVVSNLLQQAETNRLPYVLIVSSKSSHWPTLCQLKSGLTAQSLVFCLMQDGALRPMDPLPCVLLDLTARVYVKKDPLDYTKILDARVEDPEPGVTVHRQYQEVAHCILGVWDESVKRWVAASAQFSAGEMPGVRKMLQTVRALGDNQLPLNSDQQELKKRGVPAPFLVMFQLTANYPPGKKYRTVTVNTIPMPIIAASRLDELLEALPNSVAQLRNRINFLYPQLAKSN